MPELIGSFFILKVITLFSLRRDGWRGVLQALNRSQFATSSPLPLGVSTDLQSSNLPLGVPTDLQSSYLPLGVSTDLQSVVKKWPNLFMFCGFAIRSRESVMYYGLGDYKSPGLIGRTFFYDGLQIRRDGWRGMGRLARGISGHKKKSWNLRRWVTSATKIPTTSLV